jgi:hypothetical protein
MKHREQLLTTINKKRIDYDEQNMIFSTYDEKIISLEKNLSHARNSYLQERSILAVKTSDG